MSLDEPSRCSYAVPASVRATSPKWKKKSYSLQIFPENVYSQFTENQKITVFTQILNVFSLFPPFEFLKTKPRNHPNHILLKQKITLLLYISWTISFFFLHGAVLAPRPWCAMLELASKLCSKSSNHPGPDIPRTQLTQLTQLD